MTTARPDGADTVAKVRITEIVDKHGDQETWVFNFPAKDGAYPADGSDEDQSFAKFSPAGTLRLTVANPALIGKFAVGDTFYLGFFKTED